MGFPGRRRRLSRALRSMAYQRSSPRSATASRQSRALSQIADERVGAVFTERTDQDVKAWATQMIHNGDIATRTRRDLWVPRMSSCKVGHKSVLMDQTEDGVALLQLCRHGITG